MNITYVNRRFLDYMIPCIAALDTMIDNKLHVIYSREAVPDRVEQKLTALLGQRAIGLTGEWGQGGGDSDTMANHGIVINYQPGLYASILSTKPDAVFADGFFKWAMAGFACRALRKIPLVILYERTEHTEREAQWYRKLYRKMLLPFVDAMCCNGILSKEYAVSLGVPAGNITVGQAAADTDGLCEQLAEITDARISLRKDEWKSVGLVFVYVGQQIPRKGVSELLLAWNIFEAQAPDAATLVLIGEGPQGEELKNYCTNENLRNVRFVGTIDYDQIAECYAAADVFVIPTLEDNWSMVVPEAMACGLPILCSTYNGCWPELIDSGNNGWVFDPLQTDDAVKTLLLCVDNKERLREMGEHSRKIVANYSPAHSAKSILDACNIALRELDGPDK